VTEEYPFAHYSILWRTSKSFIVVAMPCKCPRNGPKLETSHRFRKNNENWQLGDFWDRPLCSRKLPFSSNSSYSSSCDIEMFVVMQRRQPKMAEIGLSSPYSFDRHSNRKICNSILLSIYVYTYILCLWPYSLYTTCVRPIVTNIQFIIVRR